ncbi:MAG: hypothetical protein LBG11_10710, partial [Bifidobacteriaceae bacterium]|nr:hypothetical protein [Bifidobacteriaceae bacterium]
MSNLTVTSTDIRSLDASIVLTGARPGEGIPGLASAELLTSLGFKGETGELLRLPTRALDGHFAAPVVAVAGLGQADTHESWRQAVGAALRQLGDAPKVVLVVDAVSAPAQPEDRSRLAAVMEGALLGAADAVELVLSLP